ncbi:MAG TPA: nuclear transport factor 2 family protein [Longimicrobium sp.]|nr:nuclear transport factor 2 family protein [Longimicrobium sp.]
MPVVPRFRAALIAAAVLLPLSAARGHAQVLPNPRDDTDERLSQYRSESLREATAMIDQWRAAWEADDLRALMRLYDRKALVQLPGDSATQQGSAAVETALKNQLPMVGRIDFGLLDAEVGGNLLYIFQRYLLQPVAPTGADSTAGPPPAVMGTTTLVLMRERGGWKIRAQMFLPTPEPGARAAQAAATADGGTQD